MPAAAGSVRQHRRARPSTTSCLTPSPPVGGEEAPLPRFKGELLPFACNPSPEPHAAATPQSRVQSRLAETPGILAQNPGVI